MWTFDLVQEALVGAMLLWRRSPDIEARFSLGGRISSIWRQSVEERALIDAVTPEPRPLPLTRAQVAEMNAVSEWLRFVPEQDRKLVVVGLAHLARGKKRVPWIDVWKALGRGKPGPEGLRKRYGAALAGIARNANAQKSGRGTVKTEKVTA